MLERWKSSQDNFLRGHTFRHLLISRGENERRRYSSIANRPIHHIRGFCVLIQPALLVLDHFFWSEGGASGFPTPSCVLIICLDAGVPAVVGFRPYTTVLLFGLIAPPTRYTFINWSNIHVLISMYSWIAQAGSHSCQVELHLYRCPLVTSGQHFKHI